MNCAMYATLFPQKYKEWFLHVKLHLRRNTYNPNLNHPLHSEHFYLCHSQTWERLSFLLI
uniref:Uncharacterized protein n=1 Tax=Rhizophora mucronata TaxID=61149 RepID=A0A2P2P3B3_RHIMU